MFAFFAFQELVLENVTMKKNLQEKAPEMMLLCKTNFTEKRLKMWVRGVRV